MPQQARRRTAPHLVRHMAVWSVVMSTMACGGQGCSGCSATPPKPQVPDALMLPSTAQARVTQHGFDVIADEIVALMKLIFGSSPSGAAQIDVSKILGKSQMSLGGGLGLFKGTASVRDLVLTLDLAALKVELVEGSKPARIRVHIDHADVGVVQGVVAGGVSFLGISSDAACHLLDGVAVGTPKERLATVSATIDLVLGVDAKGRLDLKAQVSDPIIHDVGFALAKDCKLAECTDKLLAENPCIECGICAAGSITSDALNSLKNFLGPVLGDVLELVSNVMVKQLLAAGINGKPLDVEVPVDLRALLAGPSPQLAALLGVAAPLRIRARPAPGAFFVQDGGLHSRFDAGVFAKAAGCVATVGADDSAAFAKLAQGPAPALPKVMTAWLGDGKAQDTALDVGLLLAGSVLEEGLWSILRSGLLCIAVDSAQLHALSGGRLLLTAAAVDLILPGLRQVTMSAAPVRIVVAPTADPTHAPSLKLAQKPSGQVAITMSLRAFEVRVEVAMSGRWLTVIELSADAQATLSVHLDATGKLSLAVQEVVVTKVLVQQSKLFPESGIEQIVPAAAEVAVELLLSQPISFDLALNDMLSQALALPIVLEPIGIEVGGLQQDWLILGVGLAPKSAGAP